MPSTGRKQRAGWGTLTRDGIVAAAVRCVRAGQYEQLTIRSLAAELNVSPMALYRHVRDKDDLLDEVVDRMLARRWRPRTERADWKGWTMEAAERLRAFLVTQPAALHVFLQHPVVSPSAIARMEAMLDVLRSAGYDENFARRAYASIHTYTIGFAALEASRARSASMNTVSNDVEQQLATFTTPEQFSEGLAYLIEGIDRHRIAKSGYRDFATSAY